MSHHDDALDPELLLAQSDWVRKLARHLVCDAWVAEDVAQETMLAALARPPRVGGSEPHLRAWLAGVANNLARLGRRRDARRRAREQRAARTEPEPSTAEVVTRTAQLRLVVDAALALDEPYRTAVLMHYCDALSTREVAARTGASQQTVRKRVSRGLAQLRGQLDRQTGGDRTRWVSALAPLAGLASRPAILASIGVFTMTGKMLWLAATTVVVGLAWWIGLDFTPPPPPSVTGGKPATTASLTEQDRRRGDSVVGHPDDRVAIAQQGTTTDAPLLAGRVVSTDGGAPLAGVEVLAVSGEAIRPPKDTDPIARTAADGSFTAPLPDRGTGLYFRSADHFDIHVETTAIPRDGHDGLRVRLAPVGVVLVRVVDSAGAPLAQQPVSYMVDPTLGSERQRWEWRRDWNAGQTDAAGEVRIDNLPVGMPIDIGISDSFVRPGHVVLDPARRYAEVEITPHPWGELAGRLLWRDGSPAVGIELSWFGTGEPSGSWGARRTSDAEGRFHYRQLEAGRGALFFDGGERAALAAAIAAGAATDLGEVVLDRPLPVTGRIVGEAGPGLTTLRVEAFREGGQVAACAVAEDGSFELRVSPGPALLLVARGESWEPTLPYTPHALARVMIEAPATGLELTVDAAAATLTAAVDDALAADAELEAIVFAVEQDPDSRRPRAAGRARTWRAGDLEAGRIGSGPLEPGRYHLLVQAAGLGRAYADAAEVEASVERFVGTLRFGVGSIRGKVRAADGSPLRDAEIKIVDHTGAQHLARTTPEGSFHFDRLPAGPWRLTVGGGEIQSAATRVVHLQAGDRLALDLEANATATLAGTVRTPSGPAVDRAVHVQRKGSNRSWTATTDVAGRFAIENLEPASYRFWARDAFTHTTELAAGQETDFDIVIDDRRVEVEVRAGGQPRPDVEGLHVAAANPSSPQYLWWHRGRRVAASRYEVDLPAGPLVFQLDVPGLGNNQVVIATARAVPGSDRLTLELAASGIEITADTATRHGPAPAAYLLELTTGPVRSLLANAPELQMERGADGTVRFPHVPAGALVRIVGTGKDGSQQTREIRVGHRGWTRVAW